MEVLQKVCLVFTILGGINWGLVGLFDFNIVTTIFKHSDLFVKIVYSLIGISSLINIRTLFLDFRENNNVKR